jgi:hypothetical protein
VYPLVPLWNFTLPFSVLLFYQRHPKTAVTKILKGPHREEHVLFSSLRAHYLFDSEFCNPAKGNEKGTVENLVRYVRQNMMVPLPNVSSIEELNKILLSWCEKQKQIHIYEWEQEVKELRPLPSTPFKCSRTHMVKSNSLLLFQIDRNYYSVPYEYGYKQLRVEAYVDKIEIYDRAKLIAVHNRSYNRGEKVMELEHYLPVLAIKPRASKNALVVRNLPEVYQQLRRLLCKHHTEGYKEYAKILLLNKDFDFKDVMNAIEDNINLGIITYANIRQTIISQSISSKPQEIVATSTLPRLEIPVDNPAKYNRLVGGAIA